MRSRIADPRSDVSQDERDAPAAADGPRGRPGSTIRGRSTGRCGDAEDLATGPPRRRGTDLRRAGVMAGYHTRWVRPPERAEDPERIAIREALAFGEAVYDQRLALGLSTAELAGRAGMTADEIECIEEGGTRADHCPATAPGRCP